MAGRTVTIPQDAKKGFGTTANGNLLLYTIDPTLLVGFNYQFNSMEIEYILSEYRNLPYFGQGAGLNLEAIISAAPDVLIVIGSLADSAISNAEDLQQQTGIPCVMLSDYLDRVPEAYRLLGEVFNKQERCEVLARYAENALQFANNISITPDQSLRVYFGNGIDNLETAPKGSPNADLLELVKATNVAVMPGEFIARIDVSAEQVLAWNPEVVILNGEPTQNVSPSDSVAAFMSNDNYRNVQAVKDGKVYAIPKYPYSWFDRPPGPNRLIGIYWLTGLLYPSNYNVDIKAKAREFYSLFYHMDISDAQLTALLGY